MRTRRVTVHVPGLLATAALAACLLLLPRRGRRRRHRGRRD